MSIPLDVQQQAPSGAENDGELVEERVKVDRKRFEQMLHGRSNQKS